jgi:hypothetical protein
MPTDFVLRLEWLRDRDDDNSGVSVRFPDPGSKGYQNTAWVAVSFGFEVQIDETASTDGAPWHRTGAIYGQQNQQFSLQPARPVGQWNNNEIHVQRQSYTVFLNGIQVTHYEKPRPKPRPAHNKNNTKLLRAPGTHRPRRLPPHSHPRPRGRRDPADARRGRSSCNSLSGAHRPSHSQPGLKIRDCCRSAEPRETREGGG